MDLNKAFDYGLINVFDKMKKGNGKYLKSVKKCFICNEAIDKGLLDHLEEVHPSESLKKLLEKFNEKMKDFEVVCKELYQIHYFLLMQQRKPNKEFTKSQEAKYLEMRRKMEEIFCDIFEDDEL